MTNYRYLILIVVLLSISFGDSHVVGQKVKSKYRPRPEWFNPSGVAVDHDFISSDSVAYDEQSDQPEMMNSSPFHGYIDSYVFSDSQNKEGGDKFQRAAFASSHESFANLCPIQKELVSIMDHPLYDRNYEYKPETYIQIKCVEPYHPLSRIAASSNNRICEQHDNKCIQLEKTHYFTKRLRTRRGERNNNCWEPTTLNISSDCQCMWPERRKEYYDKIYL
ncbi:hypothetical protein PVAND_007091 [Polypedilum vanderplanki]|uniref:Uncharacterized protein n=1 Tax=Polypedilum vanderplanki TaxID=319348 RepID=A0A9J6C5M2_POLVA|nr:hypothetical protein PVAND_007091 [Polypedilum vanderplanki]